MLIDNPLKRVQVDCLMAFCHSRIAGVAGANEKGTVIFNNDDVMNVTAESGKDLESILKEVASIEYINSKIENKNNIGLANMYHHHYNKLLNELDKSIPPNGQMIEGLIGLHLMVLSSKLGIINSDNLEYFEYLIGLYENENYINNSHFLEVVKNMGVISKKIFDKFWEKPKRISKKRK